MAFKMKSAIVFLIGMYVHLAFSVVMPFAAVFIFNELNTECTVLFAFYLSVLAIVLIVGWVSAAMALAAYLKGSYDKLRSGWKLLKLGSVPFYILNFAYSFFMWMVLIASSRGLLIFFAPIPVVITCTMIVQSGIFGICYVMHLRKTGVDGKVPSRIHYVMQLVSVLDVISTAVILIRERSGKKHPATEENL